MPEDTQIHTIQKMLDELKKFRENEEEFDVKKFEMLQNEISSILEKGYKRKFDSLKFYEINDDDLSSVDIDDLPF